MQKTLDQKLSELAGKRFGKDFIIADAKDADMALGIAAPGPNPGSGKAGFPYRTLDQYRDTIRQVVQQGLVDIMLMSCSTSDQLTIRERLFDNSLVTPAVRANDTTDIHICRGSSYGSNPSQPFASAPIDHIQAGKSPCSASDRLLGANLGLYSVTFNNLSEPDRRTLEAYRDFRIEAEGKGFRHFLEVFDPNVPPKNHKLPPDQMGGFINDHICRMLAGVPRASRPVFLKIVYHGPRYMEELCRYDESIIVGVLGGSSGTTYDAFKLLYDAKKYGARAALFGRKINQAEDQLSFITMLRNIANDDITPEEAVRAYHGKLSDAGIKPHRCLAHDLRLTQGVMHYAAGGTAD
ncbi:MAG: hypothetical protein ACYCUV_02045 [Phycisphaerae bacterium]